MNTTSESSEPWHDADRLERLYWKEGISASQLADRFDCGLTTVLYWMDEFGIERRGNVEAAREVNRVERAWFGVDQRGYELWTDSISGKQVKVAQLVAIANGEDPHEVFAEGTITHHRSNHPRDNRHENIEVMENSAHVRYHCLKEIPECKRRLLQSVAIMEEERA